MAEICRGYLTYIRDAGENGSRYPVTSEICYIGSDVDCNVRLRHVDVDNRHCLIKILHPKKATVHCLCKEKPVLLNDHPVDENGSPLKHGDIIQIVDVKFKWEDCESFTKKVFRSYSITIEKNHPIDAECKRFSEPLVSNFDDDNSIENVKENKPNLSCNNLNASENDVETKVTSCIQTFKKSSVSSTPAKEFTSPGGNNRTIDRDFLHSSSMNSSSKNASQVRRSRLFSQTYKTKSTTSTPETQKRNSSVIKSCPKNIPLQENNRASGREVKSRFQLNKNSPMKPITPVSSEKANSASSEEKNQHSNLTNANNGLSNEVENIILGNEDFQSQITKIENEVTSELPTFETTVPCDVNNPSLLATPKCFTKAFHSTPKGLESSKLEAKSNSAMACLTDIINGCSDRSNETTLIYNLEDNSILASPVKSVRDTESMSRKKKAIEVLRSEQDLSVEIRRHTRNTSNILKKTFEEHSESNMLSSEKSLTTPEKISNDSSLLKKPAVVEGTELESCSPEKKNDRKSISGTNKSPFDSTSELSAENDEAVPLSVENRDKSQKHDESNSVARCARNLSYISPPENNKSQEYMDSVVSTPKKTFVDNEAIGSPAAVICSTPQPKESLAESFSPPRNRRSTGIVPCVGTPSDVYRTTKGGLTPACKTRFNRTSMEVEISMGPRDSLSGLVKSSKLVRQKSTERNSTPLKADRSSARDSLQMHSPIIEEYALEAEESQNESLNNDSQYKFVSKRRRRLAKSSFGVEDRIMEESELNQSDLSNEEKGDEDSLALLESFEDENSEFVSTRIVINQTSNDSENVLNSTYTLESPEMSNSEKLESLPTTPKMIIPKSILTPLPRQLAGVRDKSAKKVTFINVKEDSTNTDISACTDTDVDSEFDLQLSSSNVNITTDVSSICGEKRDEHKNASEDERLYMSDKSSDAFSTNNTFESSGSIVEKIIAKRDKKVNRASCGKKSKSPRLSGVKRLLTMPKSPKSDYLNVSGVKEIMKTPETAVSCEKTPEKLNEMMPVPKYDVNESVSAPQNTSTSGNNDSAFTTPTMRRCSKHFRIHRSSICQSLVTSLNSALEETLSHDCSASLDNSMAELNPENNVVIPSQSPRTTFKDVLTELKEKLIQLQEKRNEVDEKTLENSLNVINDVLLDEPVSDHAAAITEETFKNVLYELKERFSNLVETNDFNKSVVAVEHVSMDNSNMVDDKLAVVRSSFVSEDKSETLSSEKVSNQETANISLVGEEIVNVAEFANALDSVVESEGEKLLSSERDLTETLVPQKSTKTEVSNNETLPESEDSIEGNVPEPLISSMRIEHVVCNEAPVEQSEIIADVSMAASEKETATEVSEKQPEIFVSAPDEQSDISVSVSNEINVSVAAETSVSVPEKPIDVSIQTTEKLLIFESPSEINELVPTEVAVSGELLEANISSQEKLSSTSNSMSEKGISYFEELPADENTLKSAKSETNSTVSIKPSESDVSILEEPLKPASVSEKSVEIKNPSQKEQSKEVLIQKSVENTALIVEDEQEISVCTQKNEKKSSIYAMEEVLDSQGVELFVTDSEDVSEVENRTMEKEKILPDETLQETRMDLQNEKNGRQNSQTEQSISQVVEEGISFKTLDEVEQENSRVDKSLLLVESSPKVSCLEHSSVVDETFKTCSLASNVTVTTNVDEREKLPKSMGSMNFDEEGEKYIKVSAANLAVHEENKENLLSLTPVTIEQKEESFVRSQVAEKEKMPVRVTKSSQSAIEIQPSAEKHLLQMPVEMSSVDEKITVAISKESNDDADLQNISLSSSRPSDVELDATLEENLSCIEPSVLESEEKSLSCDENISNNLLVSHSSITPCEDEKVIDKSSTSQNTSLDTSEFIENSVNFENCTKPSSNESSLGSGSVNAGQAASLPICGVEMITPPKSTAICVDIDKVAQLTLAGPVLLTEMRNLCKSISTSTPLFGVDSQKIMEIPQSCSTTIGLSVSTTVDEANEVSSEVSQTIIDKEKEYSTANLSSSPAEDRTEKSEKELTSIDTCGTQSLSACNTDVERQENEISISERNCSSDTVSNGDEPTLVTSTPDKEVVLTTSVDTEPEHTNARAADVVAVSKSEEISCDEITKADEVIEKVIVENVEDTSAPSTVADELVVTDAVPTLKLSQKTTRGTKMNVKISKKSENSEKSLSLNNNDDDGGEQAPRVKRERRTTRHTDAKNGNTGQSSKRGRKTAVKTSALMDVSIELARIDSPVAEKQSRKASLKRKTVHFDETNLEPVAKKSNTSASIENVRIPTPGKRKAQRSIKFSEKLNIRSISPSWETEADNLVSPCSIILPKINNSRKKVATASSTELQLTFRSEPKVSKRAYNTRNAKVTDSCEGHVQKSLSASKRGNKAKKSEGTLLDEILPSEEKQSKRQAADEVVQVSKKKITTKSSKTSSKSTANTDSTANDDSSTNERSARLKKPTVLIVDVVAPRKTTRLGGKVNESNENTSANSSNSILLKKTRSKRGSEKSVTKSPEIVEMSSKKSKNSSREADPKSPEKIVTASRRTRSRKGDVDGSTPNKSDSKSIKRNEAGTSTEAKRNKGTKRTASVSSDSLKSGIAQKKPRLSVNNSFSPAITRATRSRKVKAETLSDNKIETKPNSSRSENSSKNTKIKQNETTKKVENEQKATKSATSNKKNDASPIVQKTVSTRAAKTKLKNEKSAVLVAPVLRVTRSQNSSNSLNTGSRKK